MAAAKNMMSRLGCAAVDDVLYVSVIPRCRRQSAVERTARRYGGLTGAALVTAARLGARCAYAACLETDEFSQRWLIISPAKGGTFHMRHACGSEGCSLDNYCGPEHRQQKCVYEADGLIGAHESLPSSQVIATPRFFH